MIREDVLGGLRAAMHRGETLRQAMNTFFNAGYNKKDIEEAARFLQGQLQTPPIQVYQQQVQPSVIQQPAKIPQQVIQQPVQIVSNYTQPFQKIDAVLIIVLVSILILLLGTLILALIFRAPIINFLNNLF